MFVFFQSYTVNIFKYKGKYLLRRIPHASHGSFNPFVISNKQAHVINGNIPVRTKETDNVTGIIQQPATGTNDRRQHFMNYCLTHPEKFSCAVDCFRELNYAIFKDFIRHIERNEFFEVLHEACLQLETLSAHNSFQGYPIYPKHPTESPSGVLLDKDREQYF